MTHPQLDNEEITIEWSLFKDILNTSGIKVPDNFDLLVESNEDKTKSLYTLINTDNFEPIFSTDSIIGVIKRLKLKAFW